MRQTYKIFIAAVVGIFFTVGVLGQEKTKSLTEVELNSLMSTAAEKLSGKRIRITEILETTTRSAHVNGSKSMWIMEVIPPDRKREFFHVSGYGDLESERIWIGSLAWTRDRTTPWARKDGIKEFKNNSPELWSFKSCEKRPDEILDGVETSRYDVTMTRNGPLVASSRDYGPRATFYIKNSTIWLSKGGLLLQIKSRISSVDEPSWTYLTDLYEYEPKDLKIQAPIK